MRNPRVSSAPSERENLADRSVYKWLILTIGVALFLRLWGIGFGLPHDFTPDELHEIVRALKLGAGEYSWVPGKGGLYFFLFAEYGFLYVYLWLTGAVGNPSDFALYYLSDPTAFYLAGRITGALMGTFTCLAIYWLGRRIYGRTAGLLAAIIAATTHYHGLWSHYINVDIGMTLAVWCAFLAFVIHEETEKKRWLVGSGVLAGVAFAFKLPGVIAMFPLLLAVLSSGGKLSFDRPKIRKAATVGVAMLVTTAVVAPENILEIGAFHERFSNLLVPEAQAAVVTDESSTSGDAFKESMFDVTIYQGSGYLSILTMPTYLGLVAFALAGAAIGIRRRRRWDLIWIAFVAVFLGVMSLADRPGAERYMLPIVPALWLLAASAVAEVARRWRWLGVASTIAIIAVPLFALIRQDYTWTRPDTRVLGKEWIEANVPADAKLLLDGMRYRFIQSPPLYPNDTAVKRRVQRAGGEEHLSRGVSSRTLDLYEKAMSRVEGPRYDLHSTMWGLDVRELSYYVDECFDYVVTSSMNSHRYESPKQAQQYPLSAAFYNGLPADPRFERVRTFAPEPWKVQGPKIDIYRVHNACNTS